MRFQLVQRCGKSSLAFEACGERAGRETRGFILWVFDVVLRWAGVWVVAVGF